jgi:NADH dehydrogenase FAD-containing subunit
MHVVIIGAGYAGLACALRLARRTGRGARTARITLVNGSDQFVERIRLHERAAGKEPRALSIAQLLRGTQVELRVGWVQHIDVATRTARVGDEVLHWDRLVLALGSVVDTQTEGVREHAYTLDAASTAWLTPLLPVLAARRGRVLVVGGGPTGIEVATELAERYPSLRLLLVTRGELAAGFSSTARAHVRATLARLGIELQEHVAVEALREKQLLRDGEPIGFDACVWAAGFIGHPLARELGLAMNQCGQLLVDASLRSTSHPDVYVAGDLAALTEVRRDPMPMGCKSAFPSGLHVAENLARSLHGESPRAFAYRQVPFCVSLGRRDGIFELPARELHARRVVVGKLAAHIKELICRGTLWTLKLERRRAAASGILSARPSLLPTEAARA